MSPRLVASLVLVSVAVAGCSCDAPSDLPDASAIDFSTYPDAQPGPELCTDGIRRIDVTLPAVTPGTSSDSLVQTSRSFVGRDEVLASRIDALGNAQFARIDPRDGHVRAVGVATLGFAADAAQAFRPLPDGSTEVLFSHETGTTTSFMVATFDATAALVATRLIAMPADPEIDGLQAIVGAAATVSGFVVVGRGQASTSPLRETVLVDIREAARLERIGVAWPMGFEGGLASLDSADPQTVWFAASTGDSDGLSGVIVGRFDAGASPFAPTLVTLPVERGAAGALTVRIDVASDGTALLGVASTERLALVWIDATLSPLGTWSYPLDEGRPQLGGVAGTLTDQAILLRVGDEVRLGRGFGPGIIAGGLRPLLDGLTEPVGYLGPHDAFGALDHGFLLATWAPSLSLVTFCETP